MLLCAVLCGEEQRVRNSREREEGRGRLWVALGVRVAALRIAELIARKTGTRARAADAHSMRNAEYRTVVLIYGRPAHEAAEPDSTDGKCIEISLPNRLS